MFNSYIDYGISLWGSAAQTALKPIDVLQKKALRIITNSAYNTHTDPLFKNQNILKVKDLHKLHVGKLMYQYHNGDLPETLCNMFTRNNEIHSPWDTTQK